MIWIKQIFRWLFVEPLLNAYLNLAISLNPHRQLKRWQKTLLIISSTVIYLLAFISIIIGIFWQFGEAPLKEYGSTMILIGSAVAFAHILIALITYPIKVYQQTQYQDDFEDSFASEIEGKKTKSYSKVDDSPIVYTIEDDDGQE